MGMLTPPRMGDHLYTPLLPTLIPDLITSLELFMHTCVYDKEVIHI